MYKLITIVFFLASSLSSFGQTASISESVEYDPIGNRFFSGNDATSIIEIDTAGNLSYFGSGLPSNLGMEIIGNYMFCIVATSQFDPVNQVVVYDLTTETSVSSITIPQALVLNGMTSDGISRIWVTDFQGSAIYEIDYTDVSSPSFQQIAGNNVISNLPNGITFDESNNRLVFVSWDDDKIRQLDLTDQ